MIKLRVSMSFVLVGLTLITLLASCTVGAELGLERHDLFDISLGTLPGELDWFYRGSAAGMVDIHTRDGLIYISSSRRGKVMIFNSYGDLLTIVYDPSRNPVPDKAGGLNSSVSSWSFNSPQIITAFNEGFLVGDRIEDRPREEPADNGQFTMFNQVVLRFDREGKYLGHLGREGLGGSPFPDIFAIDIRQNGDIVVTCHLLISGTWISYWYTEDGFPVTTIQIRKNQLPDVMDDKDVIIQAVRPDPKQWALHLKADFYNKMEPGRELKARLYTLSLSTLEYTESISLPYTEGFTDLGYPLGLPEYLGTTLNGSHAMLYPEGSNTYRISMIDAQGRVTHNSRLEIVDDSKIYRRFKIQNNGLLTGIFFGNSRAMISWWRLDEILKKRQ
ncbi:putative lipoprotein [Olavius algarvensis spirochete endosymbiont]|uniref:LIC_12708 family protein n=1 Tax=Olavius algarvensis spirochete endosymbiont TaxID=260710 RepID=UPI00052D41BB|nr:hypothetical protein [Olavius algarvensis spirochete endosymbiont]KGM43044.1 hypothetical protein JY97_09845 [Alkalispirochaeta odontotermitis]CAD7838798.1 MAG: hypothetical protein [Olavius algarvensis spirochete endosymbiont]VDB01255.1 putative lipoprotein [Olavius algarvensis spirochete endosymbiont]